MKTNRANRAARVITPLRSDLPLGLSRLQWAMRNEIVRALGETGNKTMAIQSLGISPGGLYRYLENFQIEDSEWKTTTRLQAA